MKARRQRLAWAAWLLSATLLGARGEADRAIEPGMTRREVTDRLGRADGHMRAGAVEVLLFERGRVTLRNGAVTAVDLMSEEAVRARRREQDRLRAERAEACRLRRARGLQVKEDYLTDGRFEAHTAREDIEFWTDFRRSYPSIDVAPEIAAARERLRNEQAGERLQRRVARLEKQVAEAERRAERAEQRARAVGWSTINTGGISVTPTFIPGATVCTLPPLICGCPVHAGRGVRTARRTGTGTVHLPFRHGPWPSIAVPELRITAPRLTIPSRAYDIDIPLTIPSRAGRP